MKKILSSIICLSYILQANELEKDISADIEKHDLDEKRISVTTNHNPDSNTNINSNNLSPSSPSNPAAPINSSAGISAGAGQFGVGSSIAVAATNMEAVQAAAALGGVAGSSSSLMAALQIAPTVIVTEENSSSPTGPANRNLINAQTNNALAVTVPSLNGATFEFGDFSGTATGGTFSSDLITLSNTTVTQDPTNTVTNTFLYLYPTTTGGYSVSLTGATIDSATVTGASADDYFTGTHVAAGTISAGNFDIVFIEYPIGTVFDIVAGDLGPTGTFTTTSVGYGYLTGTNNITSITNGTVYMIESVNGTFNYQATDIPGATLNSTIFFTGVNAAGTAPDVNHFNASSFAGTIANAATSLTVNYIISNPAAAAGLSITNGTFAGQNLSIADIQESVTASSASINSPTEYSAEVMIDNSVPGCIDGTASVAGDVSLTENPIIILNAVVQGTMVGTTNGVTFNGTTIAAGDIDGTNIAAGTCP